MVSTPTSAGWRQRVKRRLPQAVKRAVKEAWRRHTLVRALRHVASLPPTEVPNPALLTRLRAGWGNDGWSGQPDYLEEVARHATTTTGPILECGSGLTTMLLGLLAGRRGVEVWSLEDQEEWHRHVAGMLKRHDISGVNVCFSPLRAYESFAWYTLPSRMPAHFSLVVCDGPGVSYASRYGLLPLLGHRLSPGAVILVDDAVHMTEVLRQWLTSMPVELVTAGPRFSVLRMTPPVGAHDASGLPTTRSTLTNAR